jgi:hypothetical protein
MRVVQVAVEDLLGEGERAVETVAGKTEEVVGSSSVQLLLREG